MDRKFIPGDNRLRVDVMVQKAPLLRGLKAAKIFTDIKDAGNSYTCVRLTPADDTLVITAANALAMFITTAPLSEAAFDGGGVLDVPAYEIPEILAVYGGKTQPEDAIRITAGEIKARFVDASGFIDGVDHNWRRKFMEETAPDVLAAVTEIFEAERIDSPPVTTGLLRDAVKAAKEFGDPDLIVGASQTHYLIRLGPYARVVGVIPDYFRPGKRDTEDAEDQDDEPESPAGDYAEAAREYLDEFSEQSTNVKVTMINPSQRGF